MREDSRVNIMAILQRYVLTPQFGNKFLLPLVLLCVAGIILLIFNHGVGAGYILDDHANLSPLRRLSSHPGEFWVLIFSNESGPLGRPLSIATFALEYLLRGEDTDASQRISLALHALNAVLLLVFMLLLLDGQRQRASFAIAVSVALVWAISPQKSSTVLYLVQRMTLLASTFILSAMIFYTCARKSKDQRKKIFSFALCVICLLLAPLAKESGVLVIPILAALEALVLSRQKKCFESKPLLVASQWCLAIGVVVFAVGCTLSIVFSETIYSQRPFNAHDRLLYTPAILLDYIKNFYVPDIGLLGVIHDDFAAGLTPIHKVFGLLVVSCFLGFVIVATRNTRPSYVSFGIAVFLIGHSLESSFLPLEFYFEHRNYLPSIGLSLAVIFGLSNLRDRFEGANHLILGFVVVYLITLAMATVVYNRNWSAHERLVLHHARGHPNSIRASSDFALYAAANGQYEVAKKQIEKVWHLSKTQKFARRLGFGDVVALKFAAACLSAEELQVAIPTGKRLQEELDWHAGAANRPLLFGNSVRVLGQLYEDKRCESLRWDLVSDWLYRYVNRAYQQQESISWVALKDLAVFERLRGNNTLSFVYASAAGELRPNDGTVLSIKLESALKAGDVEQAIAAKDQLEALEGLGRLRPVEESFLDYYRYLGR